MFCIVKTMHSASFNIYLPSRNCSFKQGFLRWHCWWWQSRKQVKEACDCRDHLCFVVQTRTTKLYIIIILLCCPCYLVAVPLLLLAMPLLLLYINRPWGLESRNVSKTCIVRQQPPGAQWHCRQAERCQRPQLLCVLVVPGFMPFHYAIDRKAYVWYLHILFFWSEGGGNNEYCITRTEPVKGSSTKQLPFTSRLNSTLGRFTLACWQRSGWSTSSNI